MPVHRAVVFSDVDRIGVDPDAASFAAVPAALAVLARHQVAFVLCSSKTRAELEWIQQALGIRHPFIAENGAAVFVPPGYFPFGVPDTRDVAGYETVEFGSPYGHVVETLHGNAKRLRVEIIGFSDMSVEEVATDCGLPLMQARLAKLREYDEPFRVLDADLRLRKRLIKALLARGLGCTNDGRYEHVGAPVDRGVGVGLLCALYGKAFGAVSTVGLGQTLNDVPMLRRVDAPFVVRTEEVGASLHLVTSVPTAKLTGGVGWVESILEVARAVEQGGNMDVTQGRGH